MWESRSDLYRSTLVLFFCFSWFLCSSHDWWMLSGTIRPPRWRAAFRFLVSAIVFALKICKWFLLGIYFKKNFSTNEPREIGPLFVACSPSTPGAKAAESYAGLQRASVSRMTKIKELTVHLRDLETPCITSWFLRPPPFEPKFDMEVIYRRKFQLRIR